MKKMKKNISINHIVPLALIAASLMVLASCKKEYFSPGGNENGKHFLLPSPWQAVSSGVSVSERGIINMSVPDQTTCYGIIFDENNYFNFLHDITVTHDGGKSWHAQTIPGLDNNWLNGIAASSENTVHALGWNYVNGGGNVFRSKDGGNSWQREAANAYTDPASFPDDIKFFDPQNGVLFGDPVNGNYEIYTTHDGGNTWKQVPSNNIPAPLATESGMVFYAETYRNTMWMITVSRVNSVGDITGARLLQSDDKGEHWYVRCPSLPTIAASDGALKFRNYSVGLYKTNATLYRTTDGGTTWNKVNYSGTWFSYDLGKVPGNDGWWVSTGGRDNFYPTNAANGSGSSISYDDGNHWILLDTAVNHTCVLITSQTHGYSGGISSGNGNDGVFVYRYGNLGNVNFLAH